MGYITCNAYCSYQVLEAESQGNIIVSGCLMHARRYMAEAFFINDISAMSNEQLKELPETKALLMIRDIYIEERPLKGMTADKRLAVRKEKVSPLVDRYFNYIHKLKDSGEVFSERMEKAINYSIIQEEHLRIFLTDGNICCDNGHAERCIRAYSVGRSNWLFADTVFGAELNATMYSVVSTARVNEVSVKIYLRYLLEKMPKHKSDTDRSYLETMMPWSEEYKQYEKNYVSNSMNVCPGKPP